MADVILTLELVRLGVFASTAVAGLRLWWRHRSRPAGLLAAAFSVLVASLTLSLLIPPGSADSTVGAVLRDALGAGLALFPLLLAAFACSFEDRVPDWFWVAASLAVGVIVLLFVTPPFPEDVTDRTSGQRQVVLTFAVTWVGLTIAAAVKLWRTGRVQPIARTRMRSMAVGALVLAAALLLGVTRSTPSMTALVAAEVVSIAAALLFALAFAPPRLLRTWWRRRAMGQWQQMQSDLIAAVTPGQVTRTVVPIMADVLGAGVAVISRDGEVMASAGMSPQQADRFGEQALTEAPEAPRDHWVAVDGAWLVVAATPYTPVFGRDERDLITGYALQLRLALERAELFDRNLASRRRLEEQQTGIQEMLAGLAHDLRGPLGAVEGLADLIRSSEEPADRDDLVDRIENNVGYLGRLVDAVVELARAGSTPGDRETVRLDEVLSRVVTRASERHPHLVVDVDGDLPVVVAGSLAMEQVFENLLTNAARHAGREEVVVQVRTVADEAGRVVVDVVDDGQGIPEDERERVFTPFRRGRGASGRGSGVGLSLVRRIAEAHGGRITLLDSDAGAHFRLELPSANETTPPV